MLTKIKLGLSSCLLGEKVRYDGGHKLDPFITGILGQFVEFVPVCPEAECGLGIPREAMHLVAAADGHRLITIHSRIDYTERMLAWAKRRMAELEREDLWGFIFKSGSPSCGLRRVKIYAGQGKQSRTGVGLFSREFMRHFPLVPVEDEARLQDPELRENFVERLFTMKRWRETVTLRARRRALVEFHTRHQLLLMAHSPRHCGLLDKLVAQVRELPLPEVYDRYQTLLMAALRLKSTRSKNVNVLLHALGYFKKNLAPAEKTELLEIIENYRQGDIPLIVPITLLNHYVRQYEQPYLKDQYYLHRHPLELQLRNHV